MHPISLTLLFPLLLISPTVLATSYEDDPSSSSESQLTVIVPSPTIRRWYRAIPFASHSLPSLDELQFFPSDDQYQSATIGRRSLVLRSVADDLVDFDGLISQKIKHHDPSASNGRPMFREPFRLGKRLTSGGSGGKLGLGREPLRLGKRATIWNRDMYDEDAKRHRERYRNIIRLSGLII